MGANAQTAVPAFTAGQVLTAAQQTQINTGIPVFATTVTRDAAFGGTGEKTLAEGQFAFLEDTNTTQFYDGAAWQSVGTTPGLTLVTTSTFTASASHSVNNCFSATYANYLVQFSKVTANNSTPRAITFRLRVGGVDNSTASSYQTQRVGAHTTSTAYAELLQQNEMFIEQLSDATQMNATINLTNPFTADKTGLDVKANGYRTTLNFITVYGLGEHSQTVSYDGFTILAASGTISGTIRVYGYTN